MPAEDIDLQATPEVLHAQRPKVARGEYGPKVSP